MAAIDNVTGLNNKGNGSLFSRALNSLRDFISEPRLKGVDTDSVKFTELHREILLKKRMISEVFKEFFDCNMDLDSRYLSGDGFKIEIGAGSSRFKHYYPEIITTDIKPAPYLDRVLDAQKMDLDDESVRTVFAANCFHHLPEPRKFLSELERVLVPGGGCILLEPYYGMFASKLYDKIHAMEHFSKMQDEWETGGEMTVSKGANQALSHIVFVRDREKFEAEFPGLEIVLEQTSSNYIRYLVSGGLNFRQLLPSFSIPILKLVEKAFTPIEKYCALHYFLVIRKR